MGEFYGKTPDELLDLSVEDFTIAYWCAARLSADRRVQGERQAFERKAKEMLKIRG